MKFATVTHDLVAKTVAEREGELIDLAALAHLVNPNFPEMAFPVGCDFVEAWEWENPFVREVVEKAYTLALEDLPLVQREKVRFLPVVPDARKVIAVGLNYESHCREQNKEPPKSPLLFAKLSSSLTGHLEPIIHWPITKELDYEGELAVIVGRGGRSIPEAEALDHCFGYTIMNDVTARDLQRMDRQWIRGKGLDTFGPVGPFMVPKKQVPDPQVLRIRTLVNNQVVQDALTAEMLFSVSYLVAFASEAITLHPGDIIVTGTPAGVGVFATPPRFLKPGDEVRIQIEGIGELINPVVAP